MDNNPDIGPKTVHVDYPIYRGGRADAEQFARDHVPVKRTLMNLLPATLGKAIGLKKYYGIKINKQQKTQTAQHMHNHALAHNQEHEHKHAHAPASASDCVDGRPVVASSVPAADHGSAANSENIV